MNVYLDNSATTRVYESACQKMMEVMTEDFGNPSALHTMGLAAEKRLRVARKEISKTFGSREDEVIFTSCGTESDNTAIYGAAHARKHEGREIITTKVEHPAVLEVFKKLSSEGFDVKYIGVDKQCNIDMQELKEAVTDNTTLISVMTVNNETGTIMPIREIKDICKNATLHTDAVQAMGKIDISATGADMISVSGHKIHGPKGIGALYVKKGTKLPPFVIGGGQESGMRSGTENMPGICGFAEAAKICRENFDQRTSQMKKVRKYLLDGICDTIEDVVINSPVDGCPSVLNVSFLGTRGEVILHTLEQDGIMVSTGSACSSGKKGRSHALTAMGLSDKEIEGAVRFSFSEFNTIEEMDYVIEKLSAAVKRFRKFGSFR